MLTIRVILITKTLADRDVRCSRGIMFTELIVMENTATRNCRERYANRDFVLDPRVLIRVTRQSIVSQRLHENVY